MAASTQMANVAAPDYLQGIEEQAILTAYKKMERHGMEFGRLCYDYREKHGAQGSHQGLGFEQLCTKLEIPRRTAYYWIAKYEKSIGIAAPESQPSQPWMRTLSDQAFFDVLAALQGEIRRGMEKEAIQHAMQLEGTKAHRTAVWNRLEVICAEDVGLADVDAVARIHEFRKAYDNQRSTNNSNQPETLFLAKAVAHLCRSPKSRIIDNLIHITKAEALLAPTINTDDVVVPPLEKTAIPEWVNSKGHMADGAEFFHDVKAHLENCTLDDPYALRAKELDIALEKTAAPAVEDATPTRTVWGKVMHDGNGTTCIGHRISREEEDALQQWEYLGDEIVRWTEPSTTRLSCAIDDALRLPPPQGFNTKGLAIQLKRVSALFAELIKKLDDAPVAALPKKKPQSVKPRKSKKAGV